MIEENYLIRHDAYIMLTDDVNIERAPFDAFISVVDAIKIKVFMK